MSSSPAKKAKEDSGAAAAAAPTATATDGGACLVDKDGKIPVNGVTRMFHVKVSGEQDAVRVQEAMRAVHDMVKKELGADKFGGSQRFVCKEHWDVKLFLRFKGVPALEAFMGGALKKKAEDALMDAVGKCTVKGEPHFQNFVADDWE